MKITWLPDAELRPRHVAVGEFDGVHLGHREVIRGADTVLTFEPHPRAVVAPDSAPKLLNTLEIKADLVAGLGVRELVVIPFDGSFAAQSAQEFIDHVLVAKTHGRVGGAGDRDAVAGAAGVVAGQRDGRQEAERGVEPDEHSIASVARSPSRAICS